MQTWSDSRPRDEYFDFLQKNVDTTERSDTRSIIVGEGRIGSLLYGLGKGDDIIVRRGDQIPEEPGPVYLCTRNDALDELIASCPESKREDLVFLQNGMLDPLLRKHGLVDAVTQANIYFAVTKKGQKPIDGKTDTDPEGLTSVTGKWAHAFKERLEAHDPPLSCIVMHRRDYRRSMLEKLIWISVFMLVGAVHGNISVGEVEKFHRDEVDELVGELAYFCRTTLAVLLFPNLSERLSAYSRVVAEFPTALKEFEWRNGFFYNYSMMARNNNLPDPSPMHTNYLEEGKQQGLISWP